MLFFDAHLDLAYLAVNKRDMLGPPESAVGPSLPASVTLPSLRDGAVRLALATIFTEQNGDGPEGYPEGDAERAHSVGRAQLEVYLTWRDLGHIAIDMPRVLRQDPGLGEMRGGMGVSETRPLSVEALLSRADNHAPLHIGILIENADPIRSPDELPWWVERGVRAIGLAWFPKSRYACGNGVDRDKDVGLSDLGRELVRSMDALGVIHDLSHLSDASMDQLLELTDRPVIASHSNCRALLPGDEMRHLRDDSIREIASRGGVIGLNLCRNFIRECKQDADDRPSIEEALAHVEHICEVAGHRDVVGLGSDMDGGFSANDMPRGIDLPKDLVRLTEGLAARGWSDEEVMGFAHGNFARFFAQHALRPQTTSTSS